MTSDTEHGFTVDIKQRAFRRDIRRGCPVTTDGKLNFHRNMFSLTAARPHANGPPLCCRDDARPLPKERAGFTRGGAGI
ncbi:hypothetical protein DPEC_G00003260 [Dallia pectoralis]|uniref:Uncharacterized protein n=1 Tax=Dallia pectoralis TaxID=75939 RepID=A0ACC2HJ77_DALPE|nr:hypothetical protein DPEC_G00003260 [Dallia pectoralis]